MHVKRNRQLFKTLGNDRRARTPGKHDSGGAVTLERTRGGSGRRQDGCCGLLKGSLHIRTAQCYISDAAAARSKQHSLLLQLPGPFHDFHCHKPSPTPFPATNVTNRRRRYRCSRL